MRLLLLFAASEDDAGRLAREVLREIDSLWVFLDEVGVGSVLNAPMNLSNAIVGVRALRRACASTPL